MRKVITALLFVLALLLGLVGFAGTASANPALTPASVCSNSGKAKVSNGQGVPQTSKAQGFVRCRKARPVTPPVVEPVPPVVEPTEPVLEPPVVVEPDPVVVEPVLEPVL